VDGSATTEDLSYPSSVDLSGAVQIPAPTKKKR
jgi:hypothetical protein